MRKPKTYFEQVPLEVVKEIADIDEPKRKERAGDKVIAENAAKANSPRRRFAPEKVIL